MNKAVTIASNNQHKITEFKEIARAMQSPIQFTELSTGISVEEHGSSFLENALYKAKQFAQVAKTPTLADDSGLMVDVLGGDPSIFSARYAGACASDLDNMQKLLTQLSAYQGKKITARYVAVLVFMRGERDVMPQVFHAIWEGEILLQPRGEKGFGYDPVFFIPTLGKTAAELNATEKSLMSHRGKAMRQFLHAWDQRKI